MKIIVNCLAAFMLGCHAKHAIFQQVQTIRPHESTSFWIYGDKYGEIRYHLKASSPVDGAIANEKIKTCEFQQLSEGEFWCPYPDGSNGAGNAWLRIYNRSDSPIVVRVGQ